MKPSGPEDYFLESLKIINYILLIITGLLKLSSSYWISCSDLFFCVCKWSISPKLSTLYMWSCLYHSLILFLMSAGSVVIPHFNHYIGDFCHFPFFFIVSLTRYLLLLWIFFKKPTLSLIFLYYFSVFNFIHLQSLLFPSFCLLQGTFALLFLNS